MSTVTYRLGKRVTVMELAHHCVLLMSYPLKAIRLSSEMSPFFRRLAENGEATLEELAAVTPRNGIGAIEDFLNRLEKKGWIVSCGSVPLPALPEISIVIPVRNRPQEIRECLTSLMRLDYPEEKREIIVVDDASEDDTPHVIESFPVTVHRMRERRGASACRNWGAQHANGAILCFLDSDCLAHPDWLNELMPVFKRSNVGAAGGLVDSHDDKTPLDRYEKVKSALHMGSHCTDSSTGNRFFYLPSCNLAVRRDVFLQVGGFDEKLEVGEDVDLCWRIIDTGRIVEYRPSSKVSHKHRNSIWPFCTRRFDYGTSEPLLQSLHPDRIKTFMLWPKALIFWFLSIGAVLTGAWAVILMAVAWIVTDALIRRRQVARLGVALSPLLAVAAVLRSNLSFLYHCGSFVSRYYLVGATVLTPVFPWLGVIVWSLHMGAGTVEFLSRKPRLNLFAFLGLFTLEQISYQSGVWYGCFRERFFSPLIPRMAVRPVKRSVAESGRLSELLASGKGTRN